jgi:hypothetical protein
MCTRSTLHVLPPLFLCALALCAVGALLLMPKGGLLKRVTGSDGQTLADSHDTHVRSGGIRQRLSDTSSSSASTTTPAHGKGGVRARAATPSLKQQPLVSADQPFNKCMRRDWARGTLSSPQVIEYSVAAASQGAKGVGRLDCAASSKNAHRLVMRALGYPQEAPPIDWIELPNGTSHPIICPIAQFERDAVEGRLSDPSALREFWSGLEGQVVYDSVKEHISKDLSEPFGIHADGAPTTKQDGLFTISTFSLLSKGSTRQTKRVFTVINKSALDKPNLDFLFSYLVWAFNALCAGVMPSTNWCGLDYKQAGRPLASGRRAALMQVRGDWEFYVSALGLPSWQNATNCCWLCEASEMNWAYAGTDASWRGTIRSHESFLEKAAALGEDTCVLFRIHTLRVEGVMIDTLHAVDQGVASHVIANIFIECMKHFGTNQALMTEGLQKALKKWYSENRGVYKIQGKLLYSRIRSSKDWPKLKCKAAATRHLARFAMHLCTLYNSGCLHDRRRLACITLLCRFYELVNVDHMFLPADVRAELAITCRKFVEIYGLAFRKAGFKSNVIHILPALERGDR